MASAARARTFGTDCKQHVGTKMPPDRGNQEEMRQHDRHLFSTNTTRAKHNRNCVAKNDCKTYTLLNKLAGQRLEARNPRTNTTPPKHHHIRTCNNRQRELQNERDDLECMPTKTQK